MKKELITFHAIANGLKNPRNMAIKCSHNSQVATIHVRAKCCCCSLFAEEMKNISRWRWKQPSVHEWLINWRLIKLVQKQTTCNQMLQAETIKNCLSSGI